MSKDSSGFSNIKHAYELLGVQDAASTHVIKHVMAKRWHPDLYRAGTPEQAEAARMMEHINEAYSKIQRAPLRYFTRGYTGVTPQQAKQAPIPINDIPVMPEHEHFVAMDKLEFWVRFVCGSVLGISVSLGIALRTYAFADTPPVPVLCVAIVIVLACGFGAARGGDRFWYAIFGR